ncbi:MAG: hypothetical protein ACRD96_05075, partial [Bryobacteraceae bacterium]
AYASAVVVVAAGLWLQRPAPAPPATSAQIFTATANGIEFQQNERALGLLHNGAIGVEVSAGAQGSVGARYVDASTGQVMIHNVVSAQ